MPLDTSIQFCPSFGEIFNGIPKLAEKKPDTCIKVFRDAAKWAHKADLNCKNIINFKKIGSSLGACADFLSFKDIPQTAHDLVSGAELSWKGCVTVLEKGCDLTVQGCDVISSLHILGGIKIENMPLIGRVSSLCTVKSFSIKITHNLKEIHDKWIQDVTSLTQDERSQLNLEVAKACFDLCFKTAVFALAFFTFLPYIIEAKVVSSTTLLMISTAALVSDIFSYIIENTIAQRTSG